MTNEAKRVINRLYSEAIQTKYSVIWSNATSKGNDFLTVPATFRTHEVRKIWEQTHPGCSIDEMVSVRHGDVAPGPGERTE